MRRRRVSRAKSWAGAQLATTEDSMGKTRTHLENKAPTPILVSSTLYSLRPFLLLRLNSCPHFLTPKVPGLSREMLLQVSKSFPGG